MKYYNKSGKREPIQSNLRAAARATAQQLSSKKQLNKEVIEKEKIYDFIKDSIEQGNSKTIILLDLINKFQDSKYIVYFESWIEHFVQKREKEISRKEKIQKEEELKNKSHDFER